MTSTIYDLNDQGGKLTEPTFTINDIFIISTF